MKSRSFAAVALAVLVSAGSLAWGTTPGPDFSPSVVLNCRQNRCSQNTEPDVKVAPDGTAYNSSIVGVPGGTNIWKRAIGSSEFKWGPIPEGNGVTENRGYALGGGDTAVAIAPVANAQGHYNLYIASLYAAGVSVATSKDSGATWTVNHGAAPITADRQWLVAEGAETVWLAYQDFGKGGLAVVARSDTAGLVFGPPIPIYAGDEQVRAGLFRSRFGSPVRDRSAGVTGGNLYWPYTTIADENEAIMGQVPQNPAGINRHVVKVGISADGGLTWVNNTVYVAPADTRVDAIFPWADVDSAGNVYVVWSTTFGVFLSRSLDQGATWSAPLQVSLAPVTRTVLPAVAAGDAGVVNVAFVGTEATSMDDATALWDVYMTQLVGADGAAPTQTQVKASDQAIHKGSVCLRGLGCDLPAPVGNPGDRALAEILTLTFDVDGYALIASPYDLRINKSGKQVVQANTQSLLIKQRSGGTLQPGFTSGTAWIDVTQEPK